MFTPVLLFKKIGIQFNLLPKKRHEDKTKIYYLGKEIKRKLYNQKTTYQSQSSFELRFVKRG